MDIIHSPEVIAFVPLTVALTEVVKGLGVTDRYAPLASICFGIALGFFVFPTLPSVILGGIVIGLTALACIRERERSL